MFFFIFEAGTSTDSCLTMLAFRMRVKKSAIGSVIAMLLPPLLVNYGLPASLFHARDLTLVSKIS